MAGPASGRLWIVASATANGTGFHRVIDDYMIQGGDPDGGGTGGPGYTFADELTNAQALVAEHGSYTRGPVVIANAGPDTNGSQFFIVVGDPAPLQPNYTVLGRLLKGHDVAEQIAAARVDGERPLDPVRILTIDVRED